MAIILLAEDSAILAQILELSLNKMGHTVYVTKDGFSAWEAIQAAKFDIVLTDVNMPRMNGDELCRKIKQHHELSDVPVVLISGDDIGSLIGISKNCGASDVLQKPVNPKKVDSIIRKLTSYGN